MTGWRCPWCGESPVPEPGMLCVRCQQEPDAIEFKAAHDAQCSCETAMAARVRELVS